MKAILPILICSAISAALGYYFGHITLPADKESPATAAAKTPPPAPTYQPEPVQTAPQPAPTTLATAETSPEPPTEVETPRASNATFAERASLPIQTLTDTQDRSMEAKILEVTTTDVKVRRSIDGREITIPFSMLSADDVAFCNYLREQQNAQKQSSPAPTIKEDEFDWDAYFNS